MQHQVRPDPAGVPPESIPAVKAAAVIGTLAGFAGVVHALYQQGLPWYEIAVVSLFFETLVVAAATQARRRAQAGQAAGFSILIVLAAAGASGVVSALAADGTALEVFRLVVPPLAALAWLGDLVQILRLRRATGGGTRGAVALLWVRVKARLGLADYDKSVQELDRERLLRRVIRAVTEYSRAELAHPQGGRKVQRAEDKLIAALGAYEEAGGDREVLADRLNSRHHWRDLTRPTGSSPWRALAERDALAAQRQRIAEEVSRLRAEAEAIRGENARLRGEAEAAAGEVYRLRREIEDAAREAAERRREIERQAREEAERARETAREIDRQRQAAETALREAQQRHREIEDAIREAAGRLQRMQSAASHVWDIVLGLSPKARELWPAAVAAAQQIRAAGEPVTEYRLRQHLQRLGVNSGSLAGQLTDALTEAGLTSQNAA